MKNQDFEKLGYFYLGKEYDLEQRKTGSGLVLYESKQLTTHAVCVGMTGSGKTGLCLSLLEEAAIDGIPVIAIDPKGDLGNLLLSFPKLRGEDFAPWVDPDEANRKGLSREQFAEQTAKLWQDGLAAWGQDGARITRFHDSADLAIYTPGSSAGLPLTVLRSFAAPPPALVSQGEAYRERVASSVSGLLALLGIEADPISSREHILLANVLDQAWRAGRDLDMAGFIHAVQSPPFDKVGVIDLETFYPARERFALAMKLNNLIASPGFAAWMEGEPLDVGSLLYTSAGKPRLSILSIAHLIGQRAHVLHHDSSERGSGLDSDPAGNLKPASRALHGRDLRLFSPDGQPTVKGADAYPAQAGARVWPWNRTGHPEPRGSRLQGSLQCRHLVPGPVADQARQGTRAGRTGRSLERGRTWLRSPANGRDPFQPG